MSRYWSELVATLTPYVPGEQPRHERLVKLNTNESPYAPSPQALRALGDVDGDSLRLYPDPGSVALRKAFADINGLSTDQVFLGNGSDEVLAHTFQALLKHDAPLCFPDISYSFYPVWCDLYGLSYQRIPLDAALRVRVADYPQVNGGVIIPNPNAPTGILLALGDIRALLEASPDSVVVIDEAYIDFGGESAVSLIDDYDNLLVVDLSKIENYLKMHVPGAVHIEYPQIIAASRPVMGLVPDDATLESVFSALGIDEHTHVVAYDDEGGGRAARLLWTLEVAGHKQYSLLNGGLHAWVNEGHPLETSAATPTAKTFQVRRNTGYRRTLLLAARAALVSAVFARRGCMGDVDSLVTPCCGCSNTRTHTHTRTHTRARARTRKRTASNGCPLSLGGHRTFFLDAGDYFLETTVANLNTKCDHYEVKMECSGGGATESPHSDPGGFLVDAATGAITGSPERVRDGYKMRLRAVDAANQRTTVKNWTFHVQDPPKFRLNPAANWTTAVDGTLARKYHVAETHLLDKPRLKKEQLLVHPAGGDFDAVVYLLSAKPVVVDGNNSSCAVDATNETQAVSALTDVATGAGAMNIRCEGNYTAKLVVRDGGGDEVVLRDWTFEVLRRDTDVPEYVIFVGAVGCAMGGCSRLSHVSAVRTSSQSQKKMTRLRCFTAQVRAGRRGLHKRRCSGRRRDGPEVHVRLQRDQVQGR